MRRRGPGRAFLFSPPWAPGRLAEGGTASAPVTKLCAAPRAQREVPLSDAARPHPSPPDASGELGSPRTQLALLGALALFSVGTYAALYPPTYSIIDEQGYLSYGLVLARGTPFADVAEVRATRSDYVRGHLVPEFGLGTSALLMPFVRLDWRAGFAVILATHLLGTALCALALRRARLPPLFAVLYLFHPVAVLYSRTAMSDVPTMALVMAGVAAWVGPRRRPFWAGLALGFTPHFRFAQAPAVAAVGAAVLLRDLWESRRQGRLQLRPTLLFVLGLLPGVTSWLALNALLYGGPLDVPVEYALSTAYLPHNLPRYLLSQNLIYPLALLLAVAVPSTLRLECGLVALTSLGVYGSFLHLYRGFGSFSQIVIGDRFFLPLFPFLVIPYAGALLWLLRRTGRARAFLFGAGVAGLAAGSLAISLVHQERLRGQERIQRLIYDSTREGSLVVTPGMTGWEYFFDPLGRREPVLAQWLELDSGVFHRSLYLRRLEQRIPDVFVLLAERTDRGQGVRADRRLLEELERRYVLEEVAHVDAAPDRIRILRITGRRRAPRR
jgi:hypothetical protein